MKLTIEKAIYGGAGLAHEAGMAVFVPFTLPGETVEARLTGGAATFGNAELIEVLEASPARVAARCAHFGACGGCQYQHSDYATQVAMKVEILRETLERAGLSELPEIQPHAAEAWGYRNRIRLRVGVVDGELRIGYNRRGSNEMLPIRECPIAAPLLLKAAEAVLRVATEVSAVGVWIREVAEIEIFANGDGSALQMTFFVRNGKAVIFRSFAGFCDRLKEIVPELSGAEVSLQAATGRKAKQGVAWGTAGLKYRVADKEYWVSRGGFFQVNRFLVEELVRLVTAGRGGALAWDLYAGVGLFSRVLADSFAAVVGVETVAGDLATVLKGKGRLAVGATTAEFLRGAIIQRERPDLIVMDPPRAGLGTEVCELLARVKAREMVYVSCDPTTLARDLNAMVDSGYTVKEVHMVDLFPQTFHLETVVVLNR